MSNIIRSFALTWVLVTIIPSSLYGEVKHVIKFGHIANDQNVWNLAALKFKAIVEKNSNGKIEVKVYPNAQLGKELDLINGIQLGTADMTITGESLQNWVPEAALMAVPYAIRDSIHLKKVADGDIGKTIERKILKRTNLRPIGWFKRGPRHLTSNRPIVHPDDLKGMILRVPNVPIYVSVWKALGAKPTPMDFSEVFTSLQQGTIHGQENPFALIKSSSFYEVQDFCNLTGHVISWIYVVIGEKKLKSLPKKLQLVVLDAGKEMQKYQHLIFKENEKNIEKELVEKGMTLIHSNKNAFQIKARKAVINSLNKNQLIIYKQIVSIE